MLTARFFANCASSPQTISLCVNAMSVLLSALTILLLFWTVTHLTRRLLVRDDNRAKSKCAPRAGIAGRRVVSAPWPTPGRPVCGSSAVEAEVYAFSIVLPPWS